MLARVLGTGWRHDIREVILPAELLVPGLDCGLGGPGPGRKNGGEPCRPSVIAVELALAPVGLHLV